ncbi:MAG TPA: PQQ-dependent dehydrogenase, methanol/ethanol family [Caulobacteraceae bacterium]|jgi:quinohemoprotein ethanol dehydrogenase|nr:PQQ-dependent dehydrogenase, methanol/ethanol family [Caulobacteraceae bacterium]
MIRRLLLILALLALSGCHGSGRNGAANVDRDRLLSADSEPGEWLANGRDWRGAYYSPLDQISRTSANRLGFAWAYDLGSARGLEATPVVVDGVMYTSGNWGRVYALDAATGKQLWTFVPEVDGQYARYACCDVVNRGVAIWQGMVYVGALDGWLYGLDAKTGKVVWKSDTFIERQMKHPAAISGAPQVAGDVVVIGQGGADFADGRGYVSAYDLKTGALRWRFFSVPGDPAKPFEHPELAMAAKTWAKNSNWRSGGGGTPYDGLAYDPELDLLYVGTGNASPYAWKDRSPGGGDNLFLASILAIHPKTGRLAWYYQEVPGEQWDYTATQKMILADLTIGGRKRQVLMQAPKDGFFYVLDRKTGALISAKPFVAQNWSLGFDAAGRPKINPAVDYEHGPALIYPSSAGGHNWQPMSFDPQTGLVYVPVIQASMIMAKGYDLKGRTLADRWAVNGVFVDDYPPEGVPEYGLPPLARVLAGRTPPKREGFLEAWDPAAGRVVWKQPTPSFWDGGVLSTGGGLVVQGDETGMLNVRDARTGALLKQIDTGSSIMAAPMTYSVKGVQYVAVMAGFGGGPGWAFPPNSAAYKYGNEGRILVFRLDGAAAPRPAPFVEPPMPEPPRRIGTPQQIAAGGKLFAAQCARCHANVPRGLVPDLLMMGPETHKAFDDIVLRGQRLPAGMGRFDDILSPADAQAIHAYLIDEATKAWDARQKGRGPGARPVTQRAR